MQYLRAQAAKKKILTRNLNNNNNKKELSCNIPLLFV